MVSVGSVGFDGSALAAASRSKIWRMRSSSTAGGGTGTSLVRSRLEPSAEYWYFDANEALTELERADTPALKKPKATLALVELRELAFLYSFEYAMLIEILTSMIVSTN
jgi:hypothetical protein